MLVDNYDRQVKYLRLSVTDRCNFRCVYCMSEDPKFLHRDQVLSLEELAFIARAFTELGVTKIRLTGGEPLARTDCDILVKKLCELPGLEQLAMTTNGSRLPKFAVPLKEAGLDHLNISLDTLKPDLFAKITRDGRLDRVLQGIYAAKDAGFKHIKLNAVILRGQNDDEILDLVEFSLKNGLDLTFIEEMPVGTIDRGRDRFCTNEEIRSIVSQKYELIESKKRTGGPAHYMRLNDIHIGFISPHSNKFCHECNRVRVTVEGRLLLCLGHENSIDLRAIIRNYPNDIERLKDAISEGIKAKPKEHNFGSDEQILRFMNDTGG